MEYLVAMTTHVPAGTSAEVVDDVRAREAAHTRELAAPGSRSLRVCYGSPADLTEALRRAAAAHGRHEAEIGHADPDWPDWYAAWMVAERIGGSVSPGRQEQVTP